MPQHFHNFDLTNFWRLEEWATRDCTDVYPTDEMIAMVERELGYKLPSSYVELMRTKNGGSPNRDLLFTHQEWYEIDCFFSIGNSQQWSLLGLFGSKFWSSERGYPPIGIYFANSNLGGRYCLDYSQCGLTGEPQVAYVLQEYSNQVRIFAPNFETFVRSLQGDSDDVDFELGLESPE